MENFISNYLLPLLGSFLAAIASILLAYAVKWLRDKTGIQISEAKIQEMDKAITEAIWSAEEKGKALAKDNADTLFDGVKYKWVIDFVLNRFPELSREEADQKIHAILGKTYGLGATKNQGV